MVLNSLNFCLSEKLFISPSILNEILAGYSNLGCIFFPFSTLNISCHSLLACRVSAKRAALKHMWYPLYVTCCFSLAAFNTLSLCFVFVSLISMCLGVFFLGFIFFVTLGLDWLFPLPCWRNFQLISLKNFLIPFLFLFFFWDLYNLNVGAFDMVPEVSETVLSSFHSFTLFCSSEVISTIYLPAH